MLYFSLRRKKPPWLAAAFGFLDLLFLVFVQDLEVGAPADGLFGGHGGADLVESLAEFLGNPELEEEPVVFAEFGA